MERGEREVWGLCVEQKMDSQRVLFFFFSVSDTVKILVSEDDFHI